MLINATPIRAEDGTIASVVVAMQDLAPLRALERQRAEFLGMVSHELRAPLTSIKGSTATVLGGSRVVGPAETRQFFRIIDRQADRMDALVGDLLDAGRIEAGMLSVAPEPTEVAMLVDQARNTFLTGGGRHPVLIDMAEDLPQVLADRERIVQVLNNLLANAARAAPESSPIRIGAQTEGVYVAVWVADEGTRHGAGAPGAAVRPPLRDRGACRARPGRRARAGHLQGPGGGARRAYPGRERRDRIGPARDVHGACGRPGRSPRRAPAGVATAAAAQGAKSMKGCPSWRSTTTPRRCATCARRSPKRSLRRS